VTGPKQLPTIGDHLHREAAVALANFGARRAVFLEYEADAPLLAFTKSHGYVERDRFRLADGTEVVRMIKDFAVNNA
jgi:hypothetical protein